MGGCVALGTSQSSAQVFLGNEAALTGGTVAAVTSEPDAIWYNPVTFAFAQSVHNGSNSNTLGMQVAPSQAKVWVCA